MPEPQIPRLDREDWRGAMAVFLLVFLSTFPVAIPFLAIDTSAHARRVSNFIAIVMLFVMGYVRAAHAPNAWLWGVSMVVLGVALSGLTMVLGG